ncbi:MAG: Hsp20/alpha crystallin family protein [Acaryochloridaceae cyanobacterium SU_2_1]|nr:Hsp20/alpha crystallin family protein [Acaryochloridaceae cyanobacterium SU_2_1]
MIIHYRNPIEETEAMRHQLDRIFDSILNKETTPTARPWAPTIELWDEGNHLIFKAFLPCVQADDLDIQATREAIAISGHRHQSEGAEGTQRVYSDINYGPFQRAIKLPVAIQNTAVTASFEQGVLTLTLPKVETEQNKVVKISLSRSSELSQTALGDSPEAASA